MDSATEGTACITVRKKNTTRLVKHPDSLWETSVVCSGLAAKAFPTTLLRYPRRLNQVSHTRVFSLGLSRGFVVHVPVQQVRINLSFMKFGGD